ncbi:ankyrin repeat domain-containing protein SOWAHC-like [Anoplopoma fimbria]|uniref:ankyrin repeat domain-containing protein SOWAHC-like n=1 Tax=Anoplopoma fimbria TaxID=229290 RepID=UPI0023EDA881|nr:ankyrin repeat domain-containing protein SOWAHC-like [Anoplopoma fimbria]
MVFTFNPPYRRNGTKKFRVCGSELHLPGSGDGNDSQLRAPHVFNTAKKQPESVCAGEEVDRSSPEMGNRESFKREKRESEKEKKEPEIPDISVTNASPPPADGSMFNLPGPEQTGTTGQLDTGQVDTRQVDTGQVEEEEQGEGPSSRRGSRKHFLEAMMSSSPQLRRSMVRSSVYLPSSRSDGDSASLVSSSPDEDRTSATLDPLEHEWMMCASDGEWTRLSPLLHTDPTLVLRKDFVTGFTCLHWAAKWGEPELMALLINFAKRHDVSVSVDVRSNAGYTPLHVAAMHNHMEVVKLLVGAYAADVEVRDHSGRKACQYLTDNVSVNIRDIIGAYERSDAKNADRRDGGRWRFSKVLQMNLKPLRLLDPNGCDSVDGEVRPREKVLRRRSSLSRMKPKLQRLRLRTSQIVHSTTFRDTEEQEGTGKGSFKSRPKTHFFG